MYVVIFRGVCKMHMWKSQEEKTTKTLNTSFLLIKTKLYHLFKGISNNSQFGVTVDQKFSEHKFKTWNKKPHP